MPEFDRQLEFDSEEQLVAYIRENLLTVGQARLMRNYDFTIEDLLNGRLKITGDEWYENSDAMYRAFFEVWNSRLGRREFGF